MDNLENMSIEELKKLARKKGVKNVSRIGSKIFLISAIRDADIPSYPSTSKEVSEVFKRVISSLYQK